MPSRVAQWEIRRGRQDELEKTSTGEATILVHDVEGLYDPSNVGSPYFGQLDGAPVSLNLHNPITNTWHTRFRGNVDEYGYELNPSQVDNLVTIHCVDGFDYLATAEMAPGIHGFVPLPAGVEAGNIFYEDAEVNLRIHGLLNDAGWPLDQRHIFTGNVVVSESVYDPGYSFLAAIQDAADAEFPGVANVYMDADGNVVFHGRHARFDPDTVAAGAGGAWDFTRWKVGDGDAITGDATYAQLRPPFHADRSLKMVFNAALIYPLKSVETNAEYEDLIATQTGLAVGRDATSISQFGVRSYTAQDIRILEHKTNGDNGWQQTAKMMDYYVQNYKDPRTRPRQITVKAINPEDPRADAVWEFLCGVEISDVIHLTVSNPGGGGIDEDFYVEGISTICRPANPDYPYVEVTCDVSPTAYYNEDTFTGDA